jgi:hypothetical protein
MVSRLPETGPYLIVLGLLSSSSGNASGSFPTTGPLYILFPLSGILFCHYNFQLVIIHSLFTSQRVTSLRRPPLKPPPWSRVHCLLSHFCPSYFLKDNCLCLWWCAHPYEHIMIYSLLHQVSSLLAPGTHFSVSARFHSHLQLYLILRLREGI